MRALKEYRGSLSKREQNPAYIYFHDRVLEEIARLRPGSMAALRGINGLGEKKIAAYGEDILAIMSRFEK